MRSEQSLVFHTVNVFTTKAFTGNPLAIVEDADELSDKQMQLIAREFNLPETVFIQQADQADNTAKVRIFTPVNELPFAGHPTIGCAVFLAQQQHKDASFKTQIRLEEVAGLVPVSVTCDNGKFHAQLTAPVIPAVSEKLMSDGPDLNPASASASLGLQANDIAATPFAQIGGPTFITIPVKTRQAVSEAKPTQPLCDQLCLAYGATGLYVYAKNTAQNEIDARMFAPAAGIPEDPATGSAAALMASQLLLDGHLQEGHNHFSLRQGYDMGRPSDMQLEIDVSGGRLEAVRVGGSSTGISSGRIGVPE